MTRVIGAIKSDQRWMVFSSLCQILDRVIWLSSVVNRVSRYTTSVEFSSQNILFISNQIYIRRKVLGLFSDEEILDNQQPPRKSDKIKPSKFL